MFPARGASPNVAHVAFSVASTRITASTNISDVPLGARGGVHAFGMHEPWSIEFFLACFLDTIFVPSVALDRRGARLGHGAGFYDRALAFRRVWRHWRGPRLVGLGYSFQVVPEIPVTPTDVFMDVLATDKGIYELLADEDRA